MPFCKTPPLKASVAHDRGRCMMHSSSKLRRQSQALIVITKSQCMLSGQTHRCPVSQNGIGKPTTMRHYLRREHSSDEPVHARKQRPGHEDNLYNRLTLLKPTIFNLLLNRSILAVSLRTLEDAQRFQQPTILSTGKSGLTKKKRPTPKERHTQKKVKLTMQLKLNPHSTPIPPNHKRNERKMERTLYFW